jgi:hypothetical protein
MNRGGLGISDLGKFDRALRLRWIWGQWKSPDKAWCGSELPIDSTDEALFAAATKVTVHNGSTAKFWQSSWLHGSSPAMMFPSLFQHSKRKHRSVKEALQNENWIRDIMHDMSPALLAQYVMLWTLVDGIPFNSNDTSDDEIIWWRTGDGNYSARSAYELQFEGSHLSTFPSLVWKIWAPARCKFFTWLVLQNMIWTADRLLLREWPNEYFCPFCRGNLETSVHLFQECPTSRLIWTEISNWVRVPGLHPSSWKMIKPMDEWFQDLPAGSNLSVSQSKAVCSLIILVCWSIWREQNARIFERKEPSASCLVSGIKSETSLWCQARNKALARIIGVLHSE